MSCLLKLASDKHYVLAVRLLASLAVLSLEAIEAMLDEGLLDTLAAFVEDEQSIQDQRVSVEFARWLVLIILTNVATGGEDVVKRVISSPLYESVTAVMQDSSRNQGLFKEYVFFLSNLICSASVEQVWLARADDD